MRREANPPLRTPFYATALSSVERALRADRFGADILELEFHNLSAWTDGQSLRRFIQEGAHAKAFMAHKQDLRRKTTFVYFKVLGRDLPLTWKDAIARQEQQNKADQERP